MKSEFRSNVKVEKCMRMFIKACWFKKKRSSANGLNRHHVVESNFPPQPQNLQNVSIPPQNFRVTQLPDRGVPVFPSSQPPINPFCTEFLLFTSTVRRATLRWFDDPKKSCSGLKLDFSSYYFMILGFQPPWNFQVVAILFMKHILQCFCLPPTSPYNEGQDFIFFINRRTSADVSSDKHIGTCLSLRLLCSRER